MPSPALPCPEPGVHELLDFCWDSVTEASLWFFVARDRRISVEISPALVHTCLSSLR